MIREICAVRDRAVDAFGQPIFVVAIGEAVRSFTDEVNNAQSPFNRHPGDYDLYHIGSFDDASGSVLPLDRPRMVAVGKDVVKPPFYEG